MLEKDNWNTNNIYLNERGLFIMKKREIISLLLIACIVLGGFSTTHAASKKLGLNDVVDWFGKKVEEAGKQVEAFGYKPSADNKTGLLKNVAWEFTNNQAEPYSVVLWFNTEGRDVTRIIYKYGADSEKFSQITDSLSLLFGDPTHQEYEEKKEGGYLIMQNETLTWNGEAITYIIGFANKSDGSRGTLEDAKKGTAGFSMNFIQAEKETSKAPKETIKPTYTPKPTATPKPVNVEVSVYSVDIKSTRYGTKEFYIRLKNNSSVGVDRVDFYVQAYNTYGERIDSYGAYIFSFYCDELINPGKITPKDYYYSHYSLNEAAKIKIAIVKYHRTDGRTVEVPENQYKWQTFN